MRERISLLAVIILITDASKMSRSCNSNFTIACKACDLYMSL